MRIILPAILTLCAFWSSTEKTFAQCACLPNATTATQFKISDVVFVGRVVEAQSIARENDAFFEITAKFEVTQTWKRDSAKTVTVKLIDENPKVFEPNVEWIIYARQNEDGTLSTAVSCCTRTKPLSIAAQDLKTFAKMGEKPKKIIESKPTNDSSN